MSAFIILWCRDRAVILQSISCWFGSHLAREYVEVSLSRGPHVAFGGYRLAQKYGICVGMWGLMDLYHAKSSFFFRF